MNEKFCVNKFLVCSPICLSKIDEHTKSLLTQNFSFISIVDLGNSGMVQKSALLFFCLLFKNQKKRAYFWQNSF
jgi:hypothetical protein